MCSLLNDIRVKRSYFDEATCALRVSVVAFDLYLIKCLYVHDERRPVREGSPTRHVDSRLCQLITTIKKKDSGRTCEIRS